MATLSTYTTKWVWQNLKMYLMQYATTLCDLLLEVVDEENDSPAKRYHDFFNNLDKHIGLGSYTLQRPEFFSAIPYVNVRINPLDLGGCTTEASIIFDIVFSTDAPCVKDGKTKYPGNSSEAVATFMATILEGLDELMRHAQPCADEVLPPTAFWDCLRDQTIPNPANPNKTKPWIYNMRGQVEAERRISEVVQLRTMDMNQGLSVFHVTYHTSIDQIYGDGIDCRC